MQSLDVFPEMAVIHVHARKHDAFYIQPSDNISTVISKDMQHLYLFILKWPTLRKHIILFKWTCLFRWMLNCVFHSSIVSSILKIRTIMNHPCHRHVFLQLHWHSNKMADRKYSELHSKKDFPCFPFCLPRVSSSSSQLGCQRQMRGQR